MKYVIASATVSIFVGSVIADIQRIPQEFIDTYPITSNASALNSKDINQTRNNFIWSNLNP